MVDQRIVRDVKPLVLETGKAGIEPAFLIAKGRHRLGTAPELLHVRVGKQGVIAALLCALCKAGHLLGQVVIGHDPLLEQAHRQTRVHLELGQHRHAACGGGVDGLLPLLHAGGQAQCGRRGADPALPAEPERLVLQHYYQIEAGGLSLAHMADLWSELIDLQGIAKHTAALQHLVHQIEQIEAGAGADEIPVIVDRSVHVANVGPQQLVAGLGREHTQGKKGGGGGGRAKQAAQDPA